MTQLDLTYNPPLPESRKFDGETFEPAKDADRLSRQLKFVRNYMLWCSNGTSIVWQCSEGWVTLAQIAHDLGYPESSVSARLRDLRKPKFGAYAVERRRVSGGVFEYRVSK